MGREASALCHWKGQSAVAKALLEGRELILRGDIRMRIARTAITSVTIEAGSLVIIASGETLTLELGSAEAGKWAAALLKPPPSLSQKLGIDPEHKAFLIGTTPDPELANALKGALASEDEATQFIAIIENEAGLQDIYTRAQAGQPRPLWLVYAKGKSAPISDATIRGFMRANGYMDNKTCAVSEALTATRYALRK